jgi:hypothetical protein
MATNATSIRMPELDELLVALGSCKRKEDPHPVNINMGIIRNAPIFPYNIFGIAKHVMQ